MVYTATPSHSKSLKHQDLSDKYTPSSANSLNVTCHALNIKHKSVVSARNLQPRQSLRRISNFSNLLHASHPTLASVSLSISATAATASPILALRSCSPNSYVPKSTVTRQTVANSTGSANPLPREPKVQLASTSQLPSPSPSPPPSEIRGLSFSACCNEFPALSGPGDVEVTLQNPNGERLTQFLVHWQILRRKSEYFASLASRLPFRSVRQLPGKRPLPLSSISIVLKLDWENLDEYGFPSLAITSKWGGAIQSSAQAQAQSLCSRRHIRASRQTCSVASIGRTNSSEEIILSFANLFRAMYNLQLHLDSKDIDNALHQSLNLVSLAQTYGVLASVRPFISQHLLAFTQLWIHISRCPLSYLRLGFHCQNDDIFSEALIHVVGLWPSLPCTVRGRFDDDLVALIQRKVCELEDLCRGIELSLIRLTLLNRQQNRVSPWIRYSVKQLDSDSHSALALEQSLFLSDILDWLAVSLWKWWIVEMLTFQPLMAVNRYIDVYALDWSSALPPIPNSKPVPRCASTASSTTKRRRRPPNYTIFPHHVDPPASVLKSCSKLESRDPASLVSTLKCKRTIRPKSHASWGKPNDVQPHHSPRAVSNQLHHSNINCTPATSVIVARKVSKECRGCSIFHLPSSASTLSILTNPDAYLTRASVQIYVETFYAQFITPDNFEYVYQRMSQLKLLARDLVAPLHKSNLHVDAAAHRYLVCANVLPQDFPWNA